MIEHRRVEAEAVDTATMAESKGKVLYQTDDRNAPYFYSGLERLVQNQLPVSFTSKKGGKSAAAQATDAIKKSPLWTKHLAEEDKWIGLTEWLRTKEGQEKIDSSEILGFVQEQTPKVEIRRFEDARAGANKTVSTGVTDVDNFYYALNDGDIDHALSLLPANTPELLRQRVVDLHTARRELNARLRAFVVDNERRGISEDDIPESKTAAVYDAFVARHPILEDSAQHSLQADLRGYFFTKNDSMPPRWADRHLPDGTEPFEILISPNQSSPTAGPSSAATSSCSTGTPSVRSTTAPSRRRPAR